MSRWLDAAQRGIPPSDKTDKTDKTPQEVPEPKPSSPSGWVLSELSVLSDRGKAVADDGNPSAPARLARPTRAPDAGPLPVPENAFRHGRDMNGNPKTWTGGSVSLAVWRGLSDWAKHGNTGQVWSGLTYNWEPMDATKEDME
jgi:hypothetical protein